MSCREYVVLPLDWMAILGLRFGGYPVPTVFMDFEVVCELLGIPYPLTREMRQHFGRTDTPQIHMEWLKMNIP